MIPPYGAQHRMVGPGDPAVFAFRFDRLARFGLPAAGEHPAGARILMGSAGLDVLFGSWRVRTQRANVIGAERSGPLRRWHAWGARYSAADRRLVLGGSRHGAVRLSFDRPVAGVHRREPIRLTSLTVTTTEPDELVAAMHGFVACISPEAASLDDGRRRPD